MGGGQANKIGRHNVWISGCGCNSELLLNLMGPQPAEHPAHTSSPNIVVSRGDQADQKGYRLQHKQRW
ncbi:unnamed protein product [Urochloa humidicola]